MWHTGLCPSGLMGLWVAKIYRTPSTAPKSAKYIVAMAPKHDQKSLLRLCLLTELIFNSSRARSFGILEGKDPLPLVKHRRQDNQAHDLALRMSHNCIAAVSKYNLPCFIRNGRNHSHWPSTETSRSSEVHSCVLYFFSERKNAPKKNLVLLYEAFKIS